MSVYEAAEELGISPKKVYELTHAADFPAFKLGTRTRVSRDGLREWVRKRSEKEEAAPVQEHRSGQE
ncbi:MAG: helix-turn-helix domain-containing protein [Oscillospiraceae bacterium]|nr:helix-turn-helix domain-containing protein [Oscillospiraceae bacterium]